MLWLNCGRTFTQFSHVMKKLFTLLLLALLVTVANAQPKKSDYEIIIKLRNTASAGMLDSLRLPEAKTLRLKTQSVSASKIIPLYKASQLATAKMQVRRAKVSRQGLDRIFTLRFTNRINADSLLGVLAASDELEYIQPNYIYKLDSPQPNFLHALNYKFDTPPFLNTSSYTPNDSAYTSQWNIFQTQADKAWSVTKGDTSIIVGIIDTGIDYTHPDLKANLHINPAEDINHNGTFEPWPSTERRSPVFPYPLDPNGITGDLDGIDHDGNGYPNDVIGYNFVDQPFNIDGSHQGPDGDPFDENSHGTGCAGIIGAVSNNSIGITGLVPNVRLVALRVFTGAGFADDKDIAAALAYAADNNIRVVNMSFGDVVISPIMRDAIRYAYSQGVVMTASSGNNGGDYQHFPSGYDEVISVTATDNYDQLAQFSTYGETLDLAAPGVGIVTTYPFYQGYYTNAFGGTSAAAPHAAAAAALVLALHPNYTPEQVRGVLVSTTDYIGAYGNGWNHYVGAGRINFFKAVQSVGSPIAKILSPLADAGFSTSQTVVIKGTATSPLFKSYALYYRVGTDSVAQAWNQIAPAVQRQVVSDTLGLWNISSLPDTTFTLRLVVNQDNGVTVENRIRIFIDRTPPVISPVAVSDAMVFDKHGVLFEFSTDDLCETTIYYRVKNSGTAFSPIVMAGVLKWHYQLLRDTDVRPNVDYEFYISAQNMSGLVTTTQATLGIFNLSNETVSQEGFAYKPANNLPKGYPLNKVLDFNGNGRKEVVMNKSPLTENFGLMTYYEFQTTQFVQVDSIAYPNHLIPRSTGDTDADGNLEVLSQSGGTTYLYEQASGFPFPEKLIWADSSGNTWGAAIANTKDTLASSGKRQIIERTADSTYTILNNIGKGRFTKIADLKNPVSIGKDGSPTSFGEPRVLVDDFDQDGKPEIGMGDSDGNFYFYEYAGGNTYNQTFLQQSQYIDATAMIASGNFLGNGKKQFVIGRHSSLDWISLTQREYKAPVWDIQIWQASGDNQYVKLWDQIFYNYREAATFSSSISVGDIDGDGKDELVINTYPNLYVYKYNTAQSTFKPIWYYPYAASPQVLIGDYDGNGLKEIYVANDTATLSFEYLNYRGTLAPAGVSTSPLGISKVGLTWSPVTGNGGVSQYQIFRGKIGSTSLTQIATLPSSVLSYIDSVGVSVPDTLLYAVAGYNAANTPSLSALYAYTARPHALPRLLAATYDSQDNLKITFSQQMQSLPINAGSIIVRDTATHTPNSVTLLHGGSQILAAFRTRPLSNGTYTLAVRSLVDNENAPVDTTVVLTFTVTKSATQAFYIVGKTKTSSKTVDIQFNADLDKSSAQTLANYSVSPDGAVTKAVVDASNAKLLHLELSRPIGALGVQVSVVLSGVKSTDGRFLNTDAGGNMVAFTEVKADLSQALTYPNPYTKQASGFVTFANLTQSGTIYIFTLTGKPIKKIIYNSDTGGVRWMLDNENGETVGSGVYFYRITSDGVADKIGKLAIVR
jgi:subtilisin family serine protease